MAAIGTVVQSTIGSLGPTRGWRDKIIEGNRAWDRETDSALRLEGWYVIRVWEHVGAAEATDLVSALAERGVSPRSTL